MPIAVLADIHGNYPALESMLTDARLAGARHFLIAGDLLDRSPYPIETFNCLRSLEAHFVRGNSDQYLIDYAHDPTSHPSKAVIAWAYQQVGRPAADWLDSLPCDTVVTLPGYPPIRMVHAAPGSLRRQLIPSSPAVLEVFRQAGMTPQPDPPPPLAEQLRGADLRESLLICGHTHIPWVEAVNGHSPRAAHESLPALVMNPGGGGLPVNGDPHAQYALLDWRAGRWQVEHRAVEYDYESLRPAFYQRGLLPAGGSFARACLGNLLTGQDVSLFFVQLYHQMDQALGDPLAGWEEASRRFDWRKYGL